MAFKDPFSRIKADDDKAFLRVNVRNFLDLEGRPQQFYDAINEIQSIREVLSAANETGMLQPGLANGFQYYKEAINWLRLNSPINSGYPVSAITSYDDINDSIASGFRQYIDWFKANYLVNQQPYMTIAAQIGIVKADKVKLLGIEADELAEEFKQSLYDSQQALASSTDAQTQQLSADLNQKFDVQVQQIQEKTTQAIGDIKQAQSLTIWHEAYEANIQLYQLKLNGKRWQQLEVITRLKNLHSKVISLNFTKGTYKDFRRFSPSDSIKELRLFWYLISRSIKFLVIFLQHAGEYLASNVLLSLRAQRMFWFTLLGILLVGQSVIFLVFLSKGTITDIPFENIIHGTIIASLASNQYVFAKVSIVQED